MRMRFTLGQRLAKMITAMITRTTMVLLVLELYGCCRQYGHNFEVFATMLPQRLHDR